MRYLKLRRSQTTLACFAATSLVFMAFPGIDLYVSGLFFDDGFHLNQQWWTTFMHESMGYFLGLSLAGVVGLYLFNKLRRRNVREVDGKKVIYLLLVLFIGAGLIVNVTLKNNWGRARPRDVVEFGGSKHYTPPFIASRECNKNCSFSSGEAAGGFFALALAMALSRRRIVFVSALAFGIFVSFCRIASGAHFFSDTVASFFVMLLVADVLYYYLLSAAAEQEAPRPRVLPSTSPHQPAGFADAPAELP